MAKRIICSNLDSTSDVSGPKVTKGVSPGSLPVDHSRGPYASLRFLRGSGFPPPKPEDRQNHDGRLGNVMTP